MAGASSAYRRYLQNGQQPDSATVLAAAAVVVNNATRTAANAISLLRIIVLLEEGVDGASIHGNHPTAFKRLQRQEQNEP
jgi:hypothetical protein